METKQRMKKKAQVQEKLCVACGCCAKVCPRGAITVDRGLTARVDENSCVGCGLCAKECPACVIEIQTV